MAATSSDRWRRIRESVLFVSSLAALLVASAKLARAWLPPWVWAAVLLLIGGFIFVREWLVEHARVLELESGIASIEGELSEVRRGLDRIDKWWDMLAATHTELREKHGRGNARATLDEFPEWHSLWGAMSEEARKRIQGAFVEESLGLDEVSPTRLVEGVQLSLRYIEAEIARLEKEWRG